MDKERCNIRTEINIGSYIKGKKAGRETWVSASSGIIYEGNFDNSLKNGEGLITYRDGSKIKGIFKDDKLIRKF